MRPKGRGELDSLYFNYPHFDPPEASLVQNNVAPVVIVGAGPVGMTTALSLAKQGVSSILLERKTTFNDGSRAICISRSSFQTFERLGAIAPFLKKALPWTRGRSFYRGRQILEFEMPDSGDEKYRPMYNLQQQYIEQFLYHAVAECPLVDVRWQSEVTALQDHPTSVEVMVKDPLRSYRLWADYVIAADGARSAVRSMRGLRLNGDNHAGRYVIADVQMPHDYPTIRRALFDPASRPGGTVLIHRQADDIWRIDYQLRDDEDAETAMEEANIRSNVRAVLADIGYDGDWELEWWSVYSANTLALDDYRDGRVFFAGDSAHIVPIFGVRGLNNGIADGENIGWKLAMVINGKAGPGLLDSYSPERRGATLDVFEQASKSTRFMTPPTTGFGLMRDAALSLALSQEWAGQLANPRQMTPYRYDCAPWTQVDGKTDRLAPGNVLPDCRIGNGFLSDQLAAEFTLVHCAMPRLAALSNLRQIAVPEIQGVAAQSCLVRPDGYILGRWTTPDPAVIRKTLAKALDLAGKEETPR